jgi:hypothetical protein
VGKKRKREKKGAGGEPSVWSVALRPNLLEVGDETLI